MPVTPNHPKGAGLWEPVSLSSPLSRRMVIVGGGFLLSLIFLCAISLLVLSIGWGPSPNKVPLLLISGSILSKQQTVSGRTMGHS